MNVCEVAPWLAGIISADGHVDIQKNNYNYPIIGITTSEIEWAEQIKEVVESTTDLLVWIGGPYKSNRTSIQYRIGFKPQKELFRLLEPVQHLIIPRKWNKMLNYYAERV